MYQINGSLRDFFLFRFTAAEPCRLPRAGSLISSSKVGLVTSTDPLADTTFDAFVIPFSACYPSIVSSHGSILTFPTTNIISAFIDSVRIANYEISTCYCALQHTRRYLASRFRKENSSTISASGSKYLVGDNQALVQVIVILRVHPAEIRAQCQP